MLITGQIEPELLKSSPRAIRRRAGHGSLIGCVHVFILPHTLVGIGILLAALYTTLVLLFGTTVSGRVTDHYIVYSRKSNTPSYHVKYIYRFGNQEYIGSGVINANEYENASPEAPIDVKLLPLAPNLGQQIYTSSGTTLGQAGFFWVFAIFWNGLLSVFWWALLIKPLRDRSLIISGQFSIGEITDKKVIQGKSTTYSVAYRFQPDPIGLRESLPITGKMTVRSRDWDTVREGSQVTVLYDPKRPKNSIAYQFADYEAA